MTHEEIQVVIDELEPRQWIIKQVVQPDFDRLYLEIYDGDQNFWLLFVMKSPFTRLHLSRPPLRRKGPKPRFAEFLNARIASSWITGIRQWQEDRIVLIDLLKDGVTWTLAARLWNNAANILLVDKEGVILDCFFRRPARGETTGGAFILPEKPVVPGDGPGTARKAGSELLAAYHESMATDGLPVKRGFNTWLEDNYGIKEKEEEEKRLKDTGSRLIAELGIQTGTRIRKLESRLLKSREHSQWKTFGDMVLAEAWRVPKGAGFVDLDDWRNPGASLRIPLDPKLDAVQNAQAFYDRFQKERDGLKYLEDELLQRRREEKELEDLAQAFREAPELQSLRSAVHALIALRQDSKGKANPGQTDETVGVRFVLHGFPVLVGRNSRESDELLRHHVRGNDLWLHVRDFPGGYVFIRIPRGKTVPPDVLVDAAHLAVWYSKAKGETEVDLYYTPVKYLRRPKNAKLGTILPTQEKNLHLRVEESRLRQILEPQA